MSASTEQADLQPWGSGIDDPTLIEPAPAHADPTDALPLPAPEPPRQRRRPPWIAVPAVAIASAVISGAITWTLAPRTVTEVVATSGPVPATTVPTVSAAPAPTAAATRARVTRPATKARQRVTTPPAAAQDDDEVRPALTTAPATTSTPRPATTASSLPAILGGTR